MFSSLYLPPLLETGNNEVLFKNSAVSLLYSWGEPQPQSSSELSQLVRPSEILTFHPGSPGPMEPTGGSPGQGRCTARRGTKRELAGDTWALSKLTGSGILSL